MKKKLFIATLLAGVVAATCLAGFTCNGNGDEEKEGQQQEQEKPQQGIIKGEEVTAEGWIAAINAMSDMKNYSIYMWDSITTTVTGNYKGYDYFPVNLKSESSYNGNAYCGFENVIEHRTFSETESVSGFADLYSRNLDKSDLFEQFKSSLPYDLREAEDKEESWSTYEYTVKIDEKGYSAQNDSRAAAWLVEESEYVSRSLGDIFSEPFATEEGGEEKPLAELYEAFTYSDGVYTADFWTNGTIMCTFSFSFKDGYVLNLGYKYAVPSVEEKDGLTVAYTGEVGMKVYDIGKTTATPSPEAVKAVEDYIKENS